MIVSNRVAVPSRKAGASAGGLAVALNDVLRARGGLWFGWSGRIGAEQDDAVLVERGNVTYAVCDLSHEDYEEYYNGFANRTLWPLLHYRLDLTEFARRDLAGYRRVNAYFADLLLRHVRPDDVLWLHDYHLIPLAEALRARGLHNRIGYFQHIPWPSPDLFLALPNHAEIARALCACDLVGFQTERDAHNFGRYLVEEFGASACEGRRMSVAGRELRIGVYPVGIDRLGYARTAARAGRSAFIREVRESLSDRTMLIGVDRLDYSKGLTQRLDAFERVLAVAPEWRGRLTFLQITPKSRSDIPEYAAMQRALGETAGRINGLYGEANWTPIRYVNRSYTRGELAGLYRLAKVGVVTPLRDGMNLVAKEYVAAQDPEDPGVLVLSRFAGAAAVLDGALLVNPYDIDGTASAIRQALAMSGDERRWRWNAMWSRLAETDIGGWAGRFLGDLDGLNGVPAPSDDSVVPGLA
ncbi:alpha,alpha-trehalose-phosphate synthase (UDP-forming) [Chelatococcus sp. SYSU_G07232]|uniref:Trehalose-6-phosphate synthase n=1 Tax=Chelatococcus albus TaxID=3047466 RepID=A0ABT7AHC0_9HYPH|nr:alpha,alpha-trehalose-phosphate synthase (UDP-forming) [Chelatococcus sp. SYSU_G07232]MDJ1158775.1 alpha,alpha-trehalose-phosphate synthase (UDP-forming) [Chelatococcus sp. SYSU_G07232]